MTQTITKFDKKDNMVSVYADRGQGRRQHSFDASIEQLDVSDLMQSLFVVQNSLDNRDPDDEDAILEIQDNIIWIAKVARNNKVWAIEGTGNHQIILHYTSHYHATKKAAIDTAMGELTC